jgi:hypothetical protein
MTSTAIPTINNPAINNPAIPMSAARAVFFLAHANENLLIPRRGRPPVSQPQKVVDLALSPAMILDRERIDASIDADVANKELRTLDKVRYLINGSPAETTGGCHRRAPSLPSQRHLAFENPIRKRPI